MSEKFEKKYAQKISADQSEKEPKKAEIDLNSGYLKRLELIAQVVGGDLGLKVELGEPGGDSSFRHKENKIILDPLHVKDNIEKAEFITAHEGGHRAITLGPKALGLKEEKIKEIYDQLGFSFLKNAGEDPADNNWFSKKYDALRKNVKNFYDQELEESDAINIPLGLTHPEAAQAMALLGYVPRFAFFGSEMIRFWHQKKFGQNLDSKVVEGLEKVKPFLPEVFEAIPSSYPDENEILKKARERFLITYEKIWPEFKKIVALDLDDEKLRQMLEKTEDDATKQLPKDLSKELKEKMKEGQDGEKNQEQKLKKEAMENRKQGEEISRKIKELAEQLKQAGGQTREKLDQELNERQGRRKQNERAGQELEKQLKNLGKKKKAGNQPLPLDKFSEELKKKLQEIYDQMPAAEKRKLENQARKNLEAVEDKLNQEMRGKLNLDNPPSHQEAAEQQEAQEQKEVEDKVAREELDKKIEELKSNYDKYYQEVADLVDDLYGRLEEIFIKERHPRWQKNRLSGGRLTLLKAMQFEAARELNIPADEYRRMFERKTLPQRYDYRFTFLVDLSSSMGQECNYEKIQETFKGLIVLTEVLHRLGIEFEVIGYSGKIGVKDIKSYEQDFNDEARDKISTILQMTGGGTPTAMATEYASKRLEKNKGRENFLVTLTDGVPTDIGAPKDTREILSQIRQKGEQKLVGIGLGPHTESVYDLYPAAISEEDVKKLPEVFAVLLEDMLLNPGKYR